MSHRALAGLVVAMVASSGQSPAQPRALFRRRLSMFAAIRWGAAALVLPAFFAGAAQANLVTNPGLETGNFSGWALRVAFGDEGYRSTPPSDTRAPQTTLASTSSRTGGRGSA